MKFSELPWFIRKEIINLVIEEGPAYCSINKEWLKRVAIRHGELNLRRRPPHTKKPISLFAQHIREISFSRGRNIDWDTTYGYEGIKTLSIKASVFWFPRDFKEFIVKCLKLPLLSSLYIWVEDGMVFDVNSIIERNQYSLKKLIIDAKDLTCCSAMENISLPNVISLQLIRGNHQSVLRDIINNLPRLKKLSLRFDLPSESDLFSSCKLSSLVELKIEVDRSYDKPVKVNLSSLKNLKRLKVSGRCEFDTENPSSTVKELNIKGSMKCIAHIVSNCFTNLEKLKLTIFEGGHKGELQTLIQTFTNLKELDWTFTNDPGYFTHLPFGPYAITSLKLDGKIRLTPYLLHWLSINFKLERLEFQGCSFKDVGLNTIIPFEHLVYIIVSTNQRYVPLFKQYFNTVNYPNITSIKYLDQHK